MTHMVNCSLENFLVVIPVTGKIMPESLLFVFFSAPFLPPFDLGDSILNQVVSKIPVSIKTSKHIASCPSVYLKSEPRRLDHFSTCFEGSIIFDVWMNYSAIFLSGHVSSL